MTTERLAAIISAAVCIVIIAGFCVYFLPIFPLLSVMSAVAGLTFLAYGLGGGEFR